MGLFGTEDNNDQGYTTKKITADPEAVDSTTSLGDQPYRVGASDKEAERETRFDGLAYGLAQDEGYTGTFEQFMQLMAENEEARKIVYEISQEDGFEGTMDQFDELLGLKKKGVPFTDSGLKSMSEMASESKLVPGLLERDDYDDEDGVNPVIAALTYLAEKTEDVPLVGAVSEALSVGSETGGIQSEISQQILPLLYAKDKYTDEQIERLIKLNKDLQNAPQSDEKRRFDEGFYKALNKKAKEIADNPYGDLGVIEARFEQGKFLATEQEAYEEYKKTGELNKDLLPKRELTFLDDLGAFFQAASLGDTAQAMSEVAVSSLVSMFTNPAAISAGAVTGAAGAGVGSAVPVIGTSVGAASGFFTGASALLDTTLRFNEYLNETLQEQGLEPTKENYKKILEDEDLISTLQLKALKGGISVGAIDGITTMLGASVAAKTARNGMKVAGKFKRGVKVLEGAGYGTFIDSSGGALGEATAQYVTGQERDGKAIIEEFFAEIPGAAATSTWAAASEFRKSYKINETEVTKETFKNTVDNLTDAELEKANFSTNDNQFAEEISKRLKRQGVRNNLDPSIPEGKVERIVDKELEIQKLEDKNSTSAKMKVSQLRQDIKDIVAEPEAEDIEVSDLEQTLKDQGVQFQLSTEATPEERKLELVNIARKQMDEVQESEAVSEAAQEVYEVNEVQPEKIQIDFEKDQPLAKDVEKKSIDDLVGKKANLVMADQLKVGEVTTASGKKLTRMGGIMFPLIPELKDKIAWASINKNAARNIVYGAIDSDETVVYNMMPSAIESNYALIESAVEEIKVKSPDLEATFNNFKEYYLGRKLGDKVHDLIRASNNFDDVLAGFRDLNVDERKAIAKNALPSKATKPSANTKPYIKELNELGIFVEDLTDQNIEPALKGVEGGAILGSLEITDAEGNPITDRKDADKAIVTREQAKAEGLPLHDNYPFYIRGRMKHLYNETLPFYNVMPKSMEVIDLKLAGAIKKDVTKDGEKVGEREIKTKEAIANELRSAEMSATQAREVTKPVNTQYSRFVSMVQKAIPGISVVTDQEQFNKFRDDIYARKMITKNQKVYGAVRGNTLYLNPDLENYNTPIHELGHLWINTIKNIDRATYDRGMRLVKDSAYHKRVLDSTEYQRVVKDMKNKGFTQPEIDEYILEEALATAIGDKGEAFVKASMMKKFKQWLQNLYDFIRTQLGISQFTAEEIENLSFDEFTNAVAVDILRGEPLFEESQVQTIDELQLQTSDADIYEIIRVARNNGFPEAVINKFLLGRGFTKKQIAAASEIKVDALHELPKSFYHATETATDGLNLFNKILDYAKKRVKKQGKDKAIELAIENGLKKDPIFKRSGDIVREDMIRDFTRFMGKRLKTTPNPEDIFLGDNRIVIVPLEKAERVQADYAAYKRRLKTLNEGARNLQNLQREIRDYIRKNIPRADYNKSTVNKLIKLVTDAKTDVDVANALEQVNDIIVKTQADILEKKILDLLKTKTVKNKSGRRVANLSQTQADRLNMINKILGGNTDSVLAGIEAIEDPQEKADTIIAIEIAEALANPDKSDAGRLRSLARAFQEIDALIKGGKSELRDAMQADKERREKMASDFYEGMTGEVLDKSEEARQDRRAIVISKQSKDNARNNFQKGLRSMLKSITSFGMKHFDITTYNDFLLKGLSDYTGGVLETLTSDKLDMASITYKQGMMDLNKRLIAKAEQVFGKNYRRIMQLNASKPVVLEMSDGNNIVTTQNKMYPILMNMRDESLRPGYEAQFGKRLDEVVKQIEEKINPKVLEWAEWQVNEFYPSLHERYNPTYLRMYYTNMPINKKYAGRVYRTDFKVEEFDLLDQSNRYRAAVGASSTKARQNNSNPIDINIDGDSGLMTYVRDMEYWNAYAETVRDISSILEQQDVKLYMQNLYSADIHELYKKHIQLIARQGVATGFATKFINTMTTPFIVARLGALPTIGIKQVTSAIAFSADIGPANWTTYLAKAAPNFPSLWKEITSNSTYIKDRYNTSIKETIAVYGKSNEMAKLVDTRIKDKQEAATRTLMYFIRNGDKGGIMGGLPNYLYYKETFQKNNPKATEQQAIDHAIKRFEKDTKKAQQSSDIQDRDLLQLDGNARYLNMFQTSQRQYLRKVAQGLNKVVKAAKVKDRKAMRKGAYTFLMYHSILPILYQWVGGGMAGLLRTGDWDDERDSWDLLRAALIGNINSLFVVGQIIDALADAAQNKWYASEFSSLPVLEALKGPIDELRKAKTAEDFVDVLIELIRAAGVPVRSIEIYMDNIEAIIEGKVEDTGEFIGRVLGFNEKALKPPKKKK